MNNETWVNKSIIKYGEPGLDCGRYPKDVEVNQLMGVVIYEKK